ncbi:MAG TPA: hypothetical protein V6D22_02635 [Candidatus Obscuribacterales bacterium]
MLANMPVALLLILASGILSTQPVQAATEKDFDAFWAKFQMAVDKNDKRAIVSMTKCPFLFRSKQLTPQQLVGQIDKVFPPKVRSCIIKQKPILQNGSHFVMCGDFIYTFSKVNGRYMFTDVDAND